MHYTVPVSQSLALVPHASSLLPAPDHALKIVLIEAVSARLGRVSRYWFADTFE
jgi:hypothetical protein